MGVGQAAVDKVSKGLRKGFQFLFGHVPTGRGTIFIFRSKFLSYSREGLAAGRGYPIRTLSFFFRIDASRE